MEGSMETEYPAIDRARKLFLERINGPDRVMTTDSCPKEAIELTNTLSPYSHGQKLMTNLWKSLDNDLCGRYKVTLDGMGKMEDEFASIVALMSKAPSEYTTTYPIPSIEMKQTLTQSSTTSSQVLELVIDAATNTSSNPTESKFAQTTLEVDCAILIQRCCRNWLLAINQCKSKWQHITSCLHRIVIRSIFYTWSKLRHRKRRWLYHLESIQRLVPLSKEMHLAIDVKHTDGTYGLAKLHHRRRLLKQVFVHWIGHLTLVNSNKVGGHPKRAVMESVQVENKSAENDVEPCTKEIVDKINDDQSTNEVKLGKKALRRQKREQIWQTVKERKKQKKEEKKAIRAGIEEPELDMSESAILMRKERSIMKRESFLMRANEGPTIVIDCGFEEDMSSREKKSLSQQIMFSYGINKRCDSPGSIYLTSLHGETESNLRKIGGFDTWLACTATPKSYMDVFRNESLVYLTADSPNVIEDLQTDKVYIIGGIVDRNRLKGVTYEKAIAQGIQTAKLPLDKVLEMGQSTRVLTVNHVFQILVDYTTVRDWTQATLSALPGRKGVQAKS